jgi:hypothetical protein
MSGWVATIKVTDLVTVYVEAETAEQARALVDDLQYEEETCRETVDWEIVGKVKRSQDEE